MGHTSCGYSISISNSAPIGSKARRNFFQIYLKRTQMAKKDDAFDSAIRIVASSIFYKRREHLSFCKIDQAIQAEQLTQMIADAGQNADIEGIKKDVVERIKEITDDYNTDTIVNAFNVVLKAALRKNETPTLKQMLRKTLDRLASGKTDLRPKAHKPTAEQVAQMKSDLRV